MNKFTGISKASSLKLSKEISKFFNVKISHMAINTWLKKILNTLIKVIKTFYLRNKDKKRIDFAKMILKKGITGRNIFLLMKRYLY